jgi:putative endopeptidase
MSRMEGLGNLGDAVGRFYVARYFSSTAKQRATLLAAQIKSVLRSRLEHLDWMSSASKAQALRKIDSAHIEVGYPDEWRDYSGLRLRESDLYGDIKTVAAFNWHFAADRLFKPVNPTQWSIAPQTVNAYYYAPFNQIVLTAAVLQPPAFDADADAAVNYGGIGAIFGHELTHGFDDVGRRFDAQGRLRDWWTNEDSQRFATLAANVVTQFSHCEPLPGLHVNGKLTLGENIADIGGLLLALDAYHASLGSSTAPVLDGLTGDQRFFLGFAQVRRGKQRSEALRNQIITDPHSPDECRVNTDVRNTEEWYRAFNVVPTNALYLSPTRRVHIW